MTATSSALASPRLFQAPGQLLDLQTLNPGDPVVVSVFLPDAQAGEEITAYFGNDCSSKHVVQNPNRLIYDVLFRADKLPPTRKSYDVWYVFRKATSPSVPVRIVNSSGAMRPKYSFYGEYLPGRVHSRIIASPSWLPKGPLTIQAIAGHELNGDLSLNITRGTAATSLDATTIGSISYDKTAGQWKANISSDVELDSGDLVSIWFPGETSGFLDFSVSL